MNSFNIDIAVKNVKAIADNNRCTVCDQLTGPFLRYFCGHTICEICVISAENCLLCFSPPNVSTQVSDDPLNIRVQHASDLLHAFEDLFKLNVYRWQRTSEHLKVERNLFPECIQAPSKYYNRKSLDTSIKYKENIKPPILLGENIANSNVLKMENVIHNVQQWLNKNEISLRESNFNLPRTPFTDLNVNGGNITGPKTLDKVTKIKNKLSRRKTSVKPFVSHSKNKLKESLKRINKKIRLDKSINQDSTQIKSDKNESGIVVDDEFNVIEDSQSDKDKLAWLAVLEADKRNSCDITDLGGDDSVSCKVANTKAQKSIHDQTQIIKCKVPFYQKSSLIYKNSYCKEDSVTNKNILNPNNNKNITITIDNNSFLTTIKFLNCEIDNSGSKGKRSVEVQTFDDKNNAKEITDEYFEIGQEKSSTEQLSSKTNKCIITSDIRSSVAQENVNLIQECELKNGNQTQQPVRESKCLVIDDSDTDSDLHTASDSLLEVTAEVHRSETEDDHNILTPLQQEEYENRARHRLRGHTPASTDSSDKENYDPNRAKRQKLSKKYCNKKY